MTELEIKTNYELWSYACKLAVEDKEFCDKQWVSVESEINTLKVIQETIAAADNIPNGNHYMELQKAISNHIKALEQEEGE